jgi:hypothetical protein
MNEPSSAIVVRIGLPPSLERIRRQHDRAASLGVPAHVTILYPWRDARSLTTEDRAALDEIARSTRSFDVRFAAVRRWPGIIYLEPDPAWPFNALIDRVSLRFPEFPPYGGSITEVIPHLTLVENADAPLDGIGPTAAARLPFTRTVLALDVLVEGADGHWRPRWRLPLASPAD